MDTVVANARELASFEADGFRPAVVFESERMKVVLVALEPGQAIDVHAPQVDMAVAVLDGMGEVFAGDRPRAVRAGDLAVVPAGQRRGLRATTERLIALHVVSPPPTPETHGTEREAWPEAVAASAGVTQAIHAEHQELLPHLDHLTALADEVTALEPAALHERLEGVIGFLRDVLLPHAGAEDEALYPVVDRLLRALGGTTRTMSLDHRAIASMIDDLTALAGAEPTERTRRDAQRVLDGLDALVRVHFEKEEEAYVPLLDRLPAEEADELERALAATPGHEHVH
jgi:quercetin dioxygenase-like cupin family protein/hemerythrin-like domain-containing protein